MVVQSEEAVEKIGSFGWFQLRVFLVVSYAVYFNSAVLMVMAFSVNDPPWRCKENSTACMLNGTYKIGDQHYGRRCDFPRKDWEFAVGEDFDSIVVEVRLLEFNLLFI